MAEFSKKTDVNVRFDGDLHSVNVSGGAYSPSLSIVTKAGDSIDLRFPDVEDLRNFLSMVITAAHNNDWHKDYNSAYCHTKDKNLITLDELKMWEMSHAEHEARAAQHRQDQEIAEIQANLDGKS